MCFLVATGSAAAPPSWAWAAAPALGRQPGRRRRAAVAPQALREWAVPRPAMWLLALCCWPLSPLAVPVVQQKAPGPVRRLAVAAAAAARSPRWLAWWALQRCCRRPCLPPSAFETPRAAARERGAGCLRSPALEAFWGPAGGWIAHWAHLFPPRSRQLRSTELRSTAHTLSGSVAAASTAANARTETAMIASREVRSESRRCRCRCAAPCPAQLRRRAMSMLSACTRLDMLVADIHLASRWN